MSWSVRFWWIRDNILGLLFCLAVVIVFCGVLLRPVLRSPIVDVTIVQGEVISFQTTPNHPEAAGGLEVRYQYAIRLLDNGNVVLATDDSVSLHPIGHVIKLERLRRANGGVDYRFQR